jgi:hypothetical protein
MIISKGLVFIHQPKAGGTFVTHVLKKLHTEGMKKILFRTARRLRWAEMQAKLGFYQMQFMGFPRHSGVVCIPLQYSSNAVFTTIRNPYDWYVSHFEFGWFKKHPAESGNLQDLRNRWPDYPDLTFRDFVEFANEKWWRMGDAELQENERIGWLSSRFVSMMCQNPRAAFNRVRCFDEFLNHVRVCIEKFSILQMENLNQELHDFLLNQGYDRQSLNFILDHKRVYSSSGGRTAEQKWESYYTDELKAYVRHRERLLFQLFPQYFG